MSTPAEGFGASQVPPPPSRCAGFLYRVQPGDTLFGIARRFNVGLQNLIDANPQIPNPNRISPGQLICVPAEIRCPREVDGFIYTVQPGDTLSAIATRFDVTVQDILAVNPQITNPNEILVGQRICVPRPGVRFPCAAVLTPPEELPDTGEDVLPLGSALIQRTRSGAFAVTFATVGLPAPSRLGEFDSYIGVLRIGTQGFSARLQPVTAGQPTTIWTGTRVLAQNPQSPENLLLVSPFNSTTGVAGPEVLRSFVGSCRSA